VDLLNENRGLDDLKKELQRNIPGEQLEGDDLGKIKNNTIVGDNQQENEHELIKNMLKNNMINLPGQTPMNTHVDEDKE